MGVTGSHGTGEKEAVEVEGLPSFKGPAVYYVFKILPISES